MLRESFMTWMTMPEASVSLIARFLLNLRILFFWYLLFSIYCSPASFHFLRPSLPPHIKQQATAVEWYVLLHPHHRISRSYRASLVFKSLFSNVSVSQQEESQDQEFVTLSLLCDDETQGSSVGHRPVSEACIMPHTRTWFVGTNYSLVFVMDMSASMAAVVRA